MMVILEYQGIKKREDLSFLFIFSSEILFVFRDTT